MKLSNFSYCKEEYFKRNKKKKICLLCQFPREVPPEPTREMVKATSDLG